MSELKIYFGCFKVYRFANAIGMRQLHSVSMIVWNEFLNDARVRKEAETLQSRGFMVSIHALHTPGVTVEREVLSSGVNVIRIPRSPLWRLRKRSSSTCQAINGNGSGAIGSISIYKRILRVIARLWTHLGLMLAIIKSRPDVVHAHDVNTLPTAWLASIITHSPLVYDAHEISTDREGYNSFRSFVGFIERHLMPRAAAIITTTDTRAKFFARAYGVPRPLVLQNRPRYHLIRKSTKIRDELCLEKNWPIVLYQGGLQQGRGLDLLVEAVVSVPNAYFVFIGGGRMEWHLRNRAEDLGLSPRVFFIPTVSLDDLPYYTASADIGVQPIENTCLNHFSTDSNKLFEYMMAGLPVVATAMPEIRKLVLENSIGIVVDSGNVQALATAIQSLVEDVNKREVLSRNALLAAKKFNWEEQENSLVDLYRKILQVR